MSRLARFLAGGLVVVAVLATGGCGSDEVSGPQLGSIEALLTMEGVDLDTNGGTLLLNGNVVGALNPNVRLRLEDIETGIHVIKVIGIATNCVPLGESERNITVRAGERTQEEFRYLCESTGGKDPGDGEDPPK